MVEIFKRKECFKKQRKLLAGIYYLLSLAIIFYAIEIRAHDFMESKESFRLQIVKTYMFPQGRDAIFGLTLGSVVTENLY